MPLFVVVVCFSLQILGMIEQRRTASSRNEWQLSESFPITREQEFNLEWTLLFTVTYIFSNLITLDGDPVHPPADYSHNSFPFKKKNSHNSFVFSCCANDDLIIHIMSITLA
jgi:hypothetical protein